MPSQPATNLSGISATKALNGALTAAAIERVVRTAISGAGPVPGLSVGVSQGGRLDFAEGFGLSDVSAKVAARAETIYPISSMTKTFTAAAVMQLIQAGKLSLSDNLVGFVPGLPWGREVTISELLDHTSGIADYINSKASLLGNDCPAPSGSLAGCRKFGSSQVVKWLASQPLQFAPGTKWAYSNSNYYLLGLVIERVSGLPYLSYLKAHILGPLGLTRTWMCPENADPSKVAVGYITNTTTAAPWAAVGEGAIPASDGFAAGELCSNVGDLLKWSHALSHGQVVSAASYARMTRPTRLANGTTAPYGFGLELSTPQGDGFLGLPLGQPYVGHSGGQPGFSSVLFNFPKPDLAIVVLCNTLTGPYIPFSVASGVLCLLHECP